MDEVSSPPNPTIDAAQVTSIVSWMSWVVTALAVFARLGTKYSTSNTIGGDDYLVVISTLLALSETIVVHLSSRVEDMSSDYFQEFAYTAELLYIPAICVAKISIVNSLYGVTPVKRQRFILLSTLAAVSGMFFAFELSAAFQCNSPRRNIFSRQSERCIDQLGLWISFTCASIVTDLIILLFPINFLWNLQLRPRRKLVIMIAFGSRISVVAASLCRIVYLDRTSATTSPRYYFWTLVLCTQVEQSLSIITTCVPFLRPFFDSLQTGMLAHDKDTIHMSGMSSSNQGLSSANSGGNSKPTTRPLRSREYSIRSANEIPETFPMVGNREPPQIESETFRSRLE